VLPRPERNLVSPLPLRPPRACAKQAGGAEPPLATARRAGRLAAVLQARAIPKPIHLTPDLHSPTTSPISLSIGRNRGRRRRPPKPYRRSSAPLAADPSPPFPDSNQGRSELRRALVHLPNHFPFRFRCCRRRSPSPARRPALWAELLHHFRAHEGRSTLLNPPSLSFAAALSLAGGNAAAGRPCARALFWGERRSRERSDRYARPVEIRKKILKRQNQFLQLHNFMLYQVEP